MSIEGLPAEGRERPDGGLAHEEATARILDLLDEILGLVSRRNHLFSWLRSVSSAEHEWLSVDGYYPGRRLLVLVRPVPEDDVRACARLALEHGLRLLRVTPGELGSDREAATSQLRARLAQLSVAPPQVGAGQPEAAEPPAGESLFSARSHAMAERLQAVRQAVVQAPPVSAPRSAARQSAAASRRQAAARLRAGAGTARPATGPGATPAGGAARRPAVELVAGLVAALAVELYLGVIVVAMGGRHWLLAFGLALDTAARALGAVAAHRLRRTGWSWGCILGGGPIVIGFILLAQDEPVSTDPAPLAGILSVAGLGAIVVSLLGMVLGL